MQYIQENKMVLGGVPVFSGTRVPVHALWEYLQAGDSLDDFLSDFPSVSREKAITVLKSAEDSLLHAHSH
jgi:uncharacterized protein (DUF433 family)